MPGTRLLLACSLMVLVFSTGCEEYEYCPPGQSWCWAKCVDLMNDNENCGKCDGICGPNAYCEDGACVEDYLECEDYGLVDCHGECVDITSDPDHCGGCDQQCSFANAASACMDGVCEMVMCDDNWGDCIGGSSDGCETDIASDPENCGSCGNSCDDSNDCTDDICERGQGCVNILMSGIPCDDNSDCTENDYCQSNGSCTGTIIDEDGDGHSSIPCGEDCDDGNSHISPDIIEGGPWGSLICTDGIDNDCDGATDGEDFSCECCEDVYCGNLNPCDGLEYCWDCECRPGTPVVCDDGDYCTEDTCNPADGSCSHTTVADGTACDDGDECTLGDACLSGICQVGPTPLNCNDGLTCCSGICANLEVDPENCGSCDNPCDVDSGFMCKNGVCEHCEALEFSILSEWSTSFLGMFPSCVTLYSEPVDIWVVRDFECYQQLDRILPEDPDFSLYELVIVCDPFEGCEWDVDLVSVMECDDYIAIDYQVISPCATCDASLPTCLYVLIPNSPKPVHANAELIPETDCY